MSLITTQTLLCKSYQTLSYFTLTCSMNSKVIIIIINNNQIKIYIKKTKQLGGKTRTSVLCINCTWHYNRTQLTYIRKPRNLIKTANPQRDKVIWQFKFLLRLRRTHCEVFFNVDKFTALYTPFYLMQQLIS